jgi:hypothetical protein
MPFYKLHGIPAHKKPTYIQIVAKLRKQKADPIQVHCTVGGNQIDFPGDKSTKVTELVTIKCLLNGIISTPNAQAACINLKDLYRNNILLDHEYVFFLAESIPKNNMPPKLHPMPKATSIPELVDKGMYGLPQAGKVASDTLLPRLLATCYKETGRIPGLFKHRTNSIVFALVVDDFLVQYTDPKHFTHLANTLKQHYAIN